MADFDRNLIFAQIQQDADRLRDLVNGDENVLVDLEARTVGSIQKQINDALFIQINEINAIQLQVEGDRDTAVAAKDDAVSAKNKAQEWAENNEDVPVETGQFSAKHHAIKAAASATAANQSAQNASSSETSAGQSASAALSSEQAAEGAKDTAVSAAQAASQSETNAGQSATQAGQSASAASQSALDASNSESAASGFATNAQDAVNTVSDLVTQASDAASAANQSETTAQASAESALGYSQGLEEARDTAVDAADRAETAANNVDGTKIVTVPGSGGTNPAGTVYDKDVQNDLQDSTQGRVALVGSFGGPGTLDLDGSQKYPLADLDADPTGVPAGTYYISENDTSNLPFTGTAGQSKFGSVKVEKSARTRTKLTAISAGWVDISTLTDAGETFERFWTSTGGVGWTGPWTRTDKVTTPTGTQTVSEALNRRGVKFTALRAPTSGTFDPENYLETATKVTEGLECYTLSHYPPNYASIAPYSGGNNYTLFAGGTGVDDGGSYIDLPGSGLQAMGLFADGIVSATQFGASTDLSDNSEKIQLAIDYIQKNTGSSQANTSFSSKGGSLFIPAGNYVLSSGIRTYTNAIKIYGEGMHSTILKASEDFSDDSLITMGSPDLIAYTPAQNVSSFGINMNGKDKPGILFAGLRDGSSFRDIYITAFTGTAFQSKWSETPGGSRTMSQGVHIENVHCISQMPFAGASVYKLDGLFESTLIGCKALGFASVNNVGAIGYHLGSNLEPLGSCQGVRLINCSGGNFVANPTYLDNSIGILCENVEFVTTNGCTWEQIDGVAVQFGSAASLAANRSPQRCRSDYDRFYNPNDKIMRSVHMIGGRNTACFTQAFGSVLPGAVRIDDTATECHVFVTGTNQNTDSSMFDINGPTNILEGVNSRGKFCVSGGSKFPVNMREGMVGGLRIGLNDNQASVVYKIPETTFFTPTVTLVVSTQDVGVYGILRCRQGLEPTVLFAGPNLETANTALTGTTGTDGNATISCDPSNPSEIIIENRRGFTLAFEITALGAFNA